MLRNWGEWFSERWGAARNPTTFTFANDAVYHQECLASTKGAPVSPNFYRIESFNTLTIFGYSDNIPHQAFFLRSAIPPRGDSPESLGPAEGDRQPENIFWGSYFFWIKNKLDPDFSDPPGPKGTLECHRRPTNIVSYQIRFISYEPLGFVFVLSFCFCPILGFFCMKCCFEGDTTFGR